MKKQLLETTYSKLLPKDRHEGMVRRLKGALAPKDRREDLRILLKTPVRGPWGRGDAQIFFACKNLHSFPLNNLFKENLK